MNALHNKMIKCNKCEVEVTSRKYLNEHYQAKHTTRNQTMFSCDKCKYESIIENNLIEHKKNKHDISKLNHSSLRRNPFQGPMGEKLCVFWNHGFCRHGDLCKFVHKEIPACFYQENCRKQKCPFFHFNKSLNTFLGRSLKKLEKQH